MHDNKFVRGQESEIQEGQKTRMITELLYHLQKRMSCVHSFKLLDSLFLFELNF